MFRIQPAFRILGSINSQIRLGHTNIEKYGIIESENYERRRTLYLKKKARIYNNDETQEIPIALVFGWSDCTLNNISRYSKLFENKDITVVLVKASLHSILRRQRGQTPETEYAMEILDDITDTNINRKVMLYSFSFGGSMMLFDFIRTLDSFSHPGKNIKGVIFDSSPVVPTPQVVTSLHKAFTRKYKGEFDSEPASEFFHKLLFRFSRWRKDFKRLIPELEQNPLNCPQLFLFSEKDEIAKSEDILRFIEKRKELGIDVTHRLWTDSEHVHHRKQYRQEYDECVSSFVEKCLFDEKNCS